MEQTGRRRKASSSIIIQKACASPHLLLLWGTLVILALIPSSSGFTAMNKKGLGGNPKRLQPPVIKPRGHVIKASATRKRSKINVGSEEVRYFEQLEREEMEEAEEIWEGMMMMKGQEEGNEEENAASTPPSRRKRFSALLGGAGEGDYFNRDRRVMRMGEDERAYYDRLNAYKSDIQGKQQERLATSSTSSSAAMMISTTSSATTASAATTLPIAAITWNGEMPDPKQKSQQCKDSNPAVSRFAAALEGNNGRGGAEGSSCSDSRFQNDNRRSSAYYKGGRAGAQGGSSRRTRLRRDNMDEEEGPEPFSAAWFAAEMCRRNNEGKPSLALTYWDRIRSEGVKPTASAYAQALRACNHAGDLSLTLSLLQEMREDTITDMYSGGLDWAVRLMSHSRRYLQTLDLFETLSNKGVRLRPSSFNVLMEELSGVPKWREVVKVRTLMKAYKVQPDAESYSWTITAFVAMGRMHDATKQLADMGDVGLAPSYSFVERWTQMAAQQAEGGGEEGSEAAPSIVAGI